MKKKLKIKLIFAWYDNWIGIFVDTKKKNRLYISTANVWRKN